MEDAERELPKNEFSHFIVNMHSKKADIAHNRLPKPIGKKGSFNFSNEYLESIKIECLFLPLDVICLFANNDIINGVSNNDQEKIEKYIVVCGYQAIKMGMQTFTDLSYIYINYKDEKIREIATAFIRGYKSWFYEDEDMKPFFNEYSERLVS